MGSDNNRSHSIINHYHIISCTIGCSTHCLAEEAVPFILGANIGTTITAFIAATLNSNSTSAISIAMAHFLFNFLGVLIFYPIPILRKIPIALANNLGKFALRYRVVGLMYILLVFFLIPFMLIFLNSD